VHDQEQHQPLWQYLLNVGVRALWRNPDQHRLRRASHAGELPALGRLFAGQRAGSGDHDKDRNQCKHRAD
jgi:hypothetical protein